MGLTHLIDTSVATRLGNGAVRTRLGDSVVRRRLGRTRITDLEVGFSARTAVEWDALMSALRVFPLVENAEADFERASAVQRQLAASGLKGRRLPDLLIAAAASRLGFTVLHYDQDFDMIASQTGQRVEWVVPRGSID